MTDYVEMSESSSETASWFVLPLPRTILEFCKFAIALSVVAFTLLGPVPLLIGFIAAIYVYRSFCELVAGGCTLEYERGVLVRWWGPLFPVQEIRIPFDKIHRVVAENESSDTATWQYVVVETTGNVYLIRVLPGGEATKSFVDAFAAELGVPGIFDSDDIDFSNVKIGRLPNVGVLLGMFALCMASVIGLNPIAFHSTENLVSGMDHLLGSPEDKSQLPLAAFFHIGLTGLLLMFYSWFYCRSNSRALAAAIGITSGMSIIVNILFGSLEGTGFFFLVFIGWLIFAYNTASSVEKERK